MSDRGDRRPKLKILSAFEKLAMVGRTFEHTDFDRVDFSMANLRLARFVHVSLQGCDFSQADLRGATFIACDLRGSVFRQTRLGDNRFDDSWFVGTRGLSVAQQRFVRARGGLFLSLCA
ncbi:MAG: pentapeptide repeat-containing protein [Polyangia bacterium]